MNCKLMLKWAMYYCAMATSLFVIWLLACSQAGAIGGASWIAKGVRIMGDALLLTALSAVVGRRWRWVAPVLIVLVALWSVGSLWYFRFWSDTPGVNSLLLAENLGSELFASIKALWRWSDFVLLGLAVALTCYFLWWRREVEDVRLSAVARMAIVSSGVLVFCMGQLVASHSVVRFHASLGEKITLVEATRTRLCTPIIVNTRDLATNGPVVHFFRSTKSMLEILRLRKDLTDDVRSDIERFIANSPAFAELPDSLARANAGKNVIVIVVESLNSEAVEAVAGGRRVAPVMCALKNAPGSLWLPNVATQVCTGGSGDGQLMVNTGLFPLPSFSTAIALGSHNSFPSLAHALGRRRNAAVFADDAKSWNERDAFASYGFDTIRCSADAPELHAALGADGAMFADALCLIPELPRPFLLELVTVSMHVPFDDPTIPRNMLSKDILSDASLQPIERNYLAMVNYFDARLGDFLNSLRSSELLDNTIVFIMSDHSQNIATGDSNASDVAMCMLAANCGVTATINRRVGQIDLYPTMLNLLNATSLRGWRGAGRSALLPPPEEHPSDSAARAISEQILRTNYFAY